MPALDQSTPANTPALEGAYDAVIVGAGAAGVFGAIQLRTHCPEARVLILEATNQPLAKVRISGGGRCNVTHDTDDLAHLLAHYPRGAKPLRSVFTRWMPHDTMRWFREHGVPLKTESDGRVFPVSDSSESILHCLRSTLHRLDIPIWTRQGLAALTPDAGGFQLTLTGGQTLQTRTVLLATGGNPRVWQMLSALGQAVVPPVPSLFTFNVADPLLTGLAGVSFPAVAASVGAAPAKRPQTGPLLITHWGLSAPVILKLSALHARELHASRYQGTVWVDFCPAETEATLTERFLEAQQVQAKKLIRNHCPVALPRRYWERLTEVVGVADTVWAALPKAARQRLIQALKRQSWAIRGKGAFKDEFVTAGGVALPGVDFKTLQSRHVPGLYFAGEVLDVDGLTGGFNFQNAWATAVVAAQGMAARLG